MKYEWLLLLSLLFIPMVAMPQQTCTINDLRFTLDDYDGQNQKGLTIHFSMSVKGMLNKTGKVFAFICDQDGNYIHSTVANYHTSEQYLVKVTSYTPRYENSTYKDYTTFIPYDVISKSLSNSTTRREFRIKVIVANEKNEALVNKLSSSKFSYSDWTSTCLLCNGTGKISCSFCGGLRQTPINIGYGIYYVMCQACNGTGQSVCTMCGGRGNTGVTYYASYVNENKQQQGNAVVVMPMTSNPYTNTSSASSASSASSKHICSDCHGTGLCSWCSGKGWEDFSGTVQTCWRCNGYKYCHTCGGKGYTW